MDELRELKFGTKLWSEKTASNLSLMRRRRIRRAVLKLVLKKECGHVWT